MIFFDQFKVPTIKFGKYFAEFIIPIALPKIRQEDLKSEGDTRGFNTFRGTLLIMIMNRTGPLGKC